MIRILAILLPLLVALHGLIHLMGFLAYWPLRELPALPYKTALLSGRWEVGALGMRIFSLLWLLAALGFVISAIALLLGRSWWAPVLLLASLLSLLICILDWGVAFRGAIVDVLLLLLLFVVFGFRQPPAPLPAYTAAVAPVTTQPLPSGLPAPVERYLRLTYGDEVPVYTSAVMSGRGTLRFMGVSMPARLRFTHAAGQSYRHYIETTFYGFPLLKVNERYLDGHTRFELPFGVEEDKPGVDSAANQGLWAETIFYPAYLATDPRLRWQSVDGDTAKLFVPFKDGEQEFTVEFDPATGMMTHIETLRFRDEKSGSLRWGGDLALRPGPERRPADRGLCRHLERRRHPLANVCASKTSSSTRDVSQYIRQKGP